ncbi:type I-E CRISPR-associated protein Cse2/CasB [candidate division WOR-3 bacterium]|nr:type I-E CRISPR-associated protein Cse2/CasB [candidate division WOR-3 bacterium]
MLIENNSNKNSRSAAFVAYVIKRLKKDNAFGAALRRADNPDTEIQGWEYLVSWCDLDNTIERTCFATVAAGLARAKQSIDTPSSIGSAIARSYKDGNQDDSAKRKLRHLLACNTGVEACHWVRPLLRLAESRGVRINFGLLLNDLLYFSPKVKERWAMDFYGRKEDKDDSLDA